MQSSMNLLGWDTENGKAQTAKLLGLLEHGAGYRLVGFIQGSAMLQGPHSTGYALFALCDNGGEINVEKVNHPDTLVSVASYGNGPVNAATMFCRVYAALRGEAIDYAKTLTENELDSVIAL